MWRENRNVPPLHMWRWHFDNALFHLSQVGRAVSLFNNATHRAIWVGHWCERCHHGLDCPILARALTSDRKPPQWDRNARKGVLMQETLRCNVFTRRPPPIPKPPPDFEDVPMFDVEPVNKGGEVDHA